MRPSGSFVMRVLRSLARPSTWLPLVGAVLAGLACWYVATEVAQWPPYQAKATLLIEETPDPELVGVTPDGIAIAQQTIAALIVRQPLSGDVAAEVGRGFDAESVVEHLRVDQAEGAPIVEVVATHSDPETAAAIANAAAMAAAEFDSPLAGVSLLSAAEVPDKPLYSAYLLIGIAAALGGLLTGAAVVAGRRLPGAIRSIDDLTEPGLSPIGEVRLSSADPGSMAANEWALAKLMTATRPTSATILFTSPRQIATQRPFIALHQRFLSDLFDGSGPLIEVVTINPGNDTATAEPPAAASDVVDIDLTTGPDATAATATATSETNGSTVGSDSDSRGDAKATADIEAADGEDEVDADPDAAADGEQEADAADLASLLADSPRIVDLPPSLATTTLELARDRLREMAGVSGGYPAHDDATNGVAGNGSTDPSSEESGAWVRNARSLADWLSEKRRHGELPATAVTPGSAVFSLVEGPPVFSEPTFVGQLSGYADVVLLVERGTTRTDDAAEAYRILESAGAHVIGTVLLV